MTNLSMPATDPTRPVRDSDRLAPRLYSLFSDPAQRQAYGWSGLKNDALAGLTVAIVALPLAMALAIASGSTPEKGLLTAVFAGFLISALGGTRHQIGGPTGAFVVVVFNVIQEFGLDGLFLATLMAGLILVAAGALKLGSLIRYIPEPVVAGFTAGIAVIIFSSQVGDLLGLSLHDMPGDVLGKWSRYLAGIDTLSPVALAVSLGSIGVIAGLRRWYPKAPGFLIAVIGGGLATWLFNLPIDTIGSRFGGVPASLPLPALPVISVDRLTELLPTALTIAFLAGIESLLSAVVIDGMTGNRHRPNAELIAQGVANAVSGVFGLLPATGAIARTVTNVRAGAASPLAGIFHALFVMLFLVVLGPLAVYVPMASLAGVLSVVAWNMADPGKFRHLLDAPMGDRVILLVTLFLTVAVDLTVAIQVGVVMAAILFMHRMAGLTSVDPEVAPSSRAGEPSGSITVPVTGAASALPEGVVAYQMRGPLFFGAASHLADVLDRIGQAPKVFILRMREVPMIDATGAFALQEFAMRAEARGARVMITGLHDQPAMVIEQLRQNPRSHLRQIDIVPDLSAALARIDLPVSE